jgi:hypothetical protein
MPLIFTTNLKKGALAVVFGGTCKNKLIGSFFRQKSKSFLSECFLGFPLPQYGVPVAMEKKTTIRF